MEQLDFSTPDGESISVARVGKGPPIVILHGWTATQQEWLPYAEALAEHSSVYCWTARGHGSHALQTTTPVTLECMAHDLYALITAYNLTEVVLVGHSMGALIAWDYIRQFGCGGLAGVCLVDQSPRLVTDETWKLGLYGRFSFADNQRFVDELTADFAEAVLRLGACGNNAHIKQSYQQNTPGIQALRNYLKSLHPAPLIQCWQSLALADYRPVLPAISVPTLLIYGGESQFYSQACAHHVQAAIPDAVLDIYEGADHFPHLCKKQLFINDVGAFVEQLGR